MIEYLSSPVIHEAFFKKYASKKFLKGKHLASCSMTLTNIISASIVLRRWAKEYVASFGNALAPTSTKSRATCAAIDAKSARQ
jgi:G2/mitotic-specific cyclin 1/2